MCHGPLCLPAANNVLSQKGYIDVSVAWAKLLEHPLGGAGCVPPNMTMEAKDCLAADLTIFLKVGARTGEVAAELWCARNWRCMAQAHADVGSARIARRPRRGTLAGDLPGPVSQFPPPFERAVIAAASTGGGLPMRPALVRGDVKALVVAHPAGARPGLRHLPQVGRLALRRRHVDQQPGEVVESLSVRCKRQGASWRASRLLPGKRPGRCRCRPRSRRSPSRCEASWRRCDASTRDRMVPERATPPVQGPVVLKWSGKAPPPRPDRPTPW